MGAESYLITHSVNSKCEIDVALTPALVYPSPPNLASPSIMIPFDTVKTRIVTQTVQAGVLPYNGILQTMARVAREEGVGALYTSLAPRLISVVPMIGIQVGNVPALTREFICRLLVPSCC